MRCVFIATSAKRAFQSTYYARCPAKNETDVQQRSGREMLTVWQNKNFTILQEKTRIVMPRQPHLIKNLSFQPNMALPLILPSAIFATSFTLSGKNDPKNII